MSKVINIGCALLGEDLAVKRRAHIEIRDGVISHIGDGYVLKSSLNAKKLLAMPSLVNAHLHLLDYAFLEYGINLGLSELVAEPNGLKHKLLAKLKRSQAIQACDIVFRKLLRSGVTCAIVFLELKEFGREVKNIAERYKIKTLILGRPKLRGVTPSALTELLSDVDGIGLDSPLRYTARELELIKTECSKLRRVVSTHIAEDERSYKMGDFEIALRWLNPNFVVHASALSRRDIRRLALSGMSVVVCPRSNLWFGTVEPPLKEFIRSKVNLLVGTDNAGITEPDIWRELEYMLILQRKQRYIRPKEILKAATVNITKAKLPLDFSNVIEEGKAANFILIKLSQLELQSSADFYATIIKRGGPLSAHYAVIGGDIVNLRKMR